MDPLSTVASTSAANAAIGVSGLLRDGWSGISEAISNTATAAAQSSSSLPNPLSLNTSGLLSSAVSISTPAASTPTPIPVTPSPAATGDLLELTSRLTRQLKRAEETCRRIEVRERNRVEVLRRCLVACCAKESAEVLELALEISANEEPDVERDSREFKELLIVRSRPDEQIEVELDRIASLERELKEERAARMLAEENMAVVEARIKTQQDAWQKERERYISERQSVEDVVRERLSVEAKSFAARLMAIEQSNKDRMNLETAKLHDKIRGLEARLEMETSINRQRKELEDARNSEAVRQATDEMDEEMHRLRTKIHELEETTQPQRELLHLAKNQANRERVVLSLENQIRELQSKCNLQETEMDELRNQLQGAVPAEYLGPARGDYLRHVVLKYLTFESMSQRQALIPVLAMLLNFTPDEKKHCEACAARDAAKEGVLGSLTSSLQSIPSIPLFNTSVQVPVRNVPRAASTGRYTPVATHSNGNLDQAGE